MITLKGKTVRLLRTHMDVKLREIATEIDYSFSYLARVEKGLLPMTEKLNGKLLNYFLQHMDEAKIIEVNQLF